MPEKFTGEPCVRWPPLRQIHAEERVARLEEGEHRRGVRLRAGVRLHVRVLGAEELLRAIDRELLDLVHDLAAAVVALARQSLGVLVRERRAHRLEHRRRHEVLARDQLEPVVLPRDLLVDERRRSPDRPRAARRRADSGPIRSRIVISDSPRCECSSRSIFSTRRAWRPPSNGVSSQVFRIVAPFVSPTKRAGSTSTFASLCSRASSAISGVHATAARTCGYRFAA